MSDVEPCARCGRTTPPLVPDPRPPAGPACVCIPCAGQALGLTPREMVKAIVELMAENLGAPRGTKHIDDRARCPACHSMMSDHTPVQFNQCVNAQTKRDLGL